MAQTQNNSNNFFTLFRTLGSRNYRLYFTGQGISLIGTWMQMIAMSWLVYRMTNSVFMLGFVSFAGQLPSFFLAPFSGVIADRLNKHKILVMTQTISMLQAFVIAALVLFHIISVWHIVVLNIILGLVNSLDMPARQSFVVEIIEKKEDLGNAIALNSAMFNGARMIGPSIAGVLVAAIGEGPCFFLNGLSFLAVIAALLAMKLPKREARKTDKKILAELKEGLVYTYTFAPIRYILMLLALVSLVASPYVVLMPVFARDILHGNSMTLGFLMAASGIGAISGALFLAARKSIIGIGRIIPAAAATFGLGLVLLSFSRGFIAFSLILVFVGFGMMVHMASSNTLLQTLVDDDKRGRVMSLYTMSFLGMAMFGNLLIGSLAHVLGAQTAVMIGGTFCVAGAFAFGLLFPRLREQIRPVFIKKGIIPEVALGINTATEITEPPE